MMGPEISVIIAKNSESEEREAYKRENILIRVKVKH